MEKVLIANRGEIAVRIINACRELGLKTVAVYSTADKNALHAQIADEAVCIGPPPASESYLNTKAIIAAAEQKGADALHPGFGFLSENATFASSCKKCGITFVGPPAEVINSLGDKAIAKTTMKKAGVPVIPGSADYIDGAVKDFQQAKEIAAKIGYPLLVKAAAGGGGRGIRAVNSEDELEHQLTAAKTESKNFFGDDSVYLEKLLKNPKHVEFQIIADSYGDVVHLNERDCSMQRRRQKVLEECPCMELTAEMREKMGAAAVSAAKAANYQNAGTIEFLVENGQFFFMEMNTRIQVEHPVTELATGCDLVNLQLKIAAGEHLGFTQDDVKINGHVIECRINAENPALDFRPSPGMIDALHIPGGNGVRVDTAIYQGYNIPPYYDSMLAKLIVHAGNRKDAIMKMRRALSEFIVTGVHTNIDFQLELLKRADFESGNYGINSLN